MGGVIDTAMDVIEAEYEVLKGALPRGYSAFEPDLLAELVKIFNRAAIKAASGDVFGRIYEYFLNQFAQSGAQDGGEFFTPPSLVRMIVNVIEPDHGMVLDPGLRLGRHVRADRPLHRGRTPSEPQRQGRPSTARKRPRPTPSSPA